LVLAVVFVARQPTVEASLLPTDHVTFKTEPELAIKAHLFPGLAIKAYVRALCLLNRARVRHQA